MPPQQTNQPFQPYPVTPNLAPNPGPVSANSKHHHSLGLIIALVVTTLLLLSAIGFGVWAFMSRQEYKDHSDKLSDKAVAIAVQQESTKKDTEFVEKEKFPLKKYLGPEAFGSVSISYPKTWGAYVEQADRASIPVNGYFHPNFVPGMQSGTAFALRIQVTNQTYESELKQFESKVKSGKVKVTPFTAKNVPNAVGARVDGEINNGQKDSMVLLPLRDKTLKISSESPDFAGDFDKIILENLKFVP